MQRTNLTGAVHSITPRLPSRIITLNRSAGQAITLPEAKGTGQEYKFVLGTSITSNSTTIKVTGNDVIKGNALLGQDGGNASVFFEAGATADTITFNGSTTGGLAGTVVHLIDIAEDEWFVNIVGAATGTEATPFSATVT